MKVNIKIVVLGKSVDKSPPEEMLVLHTALFEMLATNWPIEPAPHDR
jgi:hypothetical protein